MQNVREQLQGADDRVRRLREERGRLNKVFEAAKTAAAENETEATLNAATAAKESLKDVERQIEVAQEEQISLLGRLGDAEQGRSGLAFSGANGWADAARRLDLAHGETRVDLAGGALLQRPMAAVNVPDLSGTGAAVRRLPASAPPQDRRFAYPALRQQPVDSSGLAVGGFTIEFTTSGLSGVTGIERPPMSTDPKAELDANVGWDQKDMRQFAITMDDVPVKILEAEVIHGRIEKADSARELNDALATVISGMWGGNLRRPAAGRVRSAASGRVQAAGRQGAGLLVQRQAQPAGAPPR